MMFLLNEEGKFVENLLVLITSTKAGCKLRREAATRAAKLLFQYLVNLIFIREKSEF